MLCSDFNGVVIYKLQLYLNYYAVLWIRVYVTFSCTVRVGYFKVQYWVKNVCKHFYSAVNYILFIFMTKISVDNLNSGTRKKGRPKRLQAFKVKRTQYCDTDPNSKLLKQLPTLCNYDMKWFTCNKVCNEDIQENRQRLYCHDEEKKLKIKCCVFFISAISVKRNRPKDGTKPKSVSLKIFMQTSSGMSTKRVFILSWAYRSHV